MRMLSASRLAGWRGGTDIYIDQCIRS
jgi:hypothetical protein